MVTKAPLFFSYHLSKLSYMNLVLLYLHDVCVTFICILKSNSNASFSITYLKTLHISDLQVSTDFVLRKPNCVYGGGIKILLGAFKN